MMKVDPQCCSITGLLRLLLVCALFFLFQLLTLSKAPHPRGVQLLAWEFSKSSGYISSGSPGTEAFADLLGISTAATFDPQYSAEHSRRLRSQPFRPQGPEFELEIAGRFPPVKLPVPVIEFFDASGKEVASTPIPLRSRPPLFREWTAYRFRLPPELAGQEQIALRVSLPPRPQSQDSLAIRGRVVFFDAPTLRQRISETCLRHPKLARFLASILVAATVLLIFPIGVRAFAARQYLRLFFLFFLFAAGVHFRETLFYHWDEWHVLARFQDQGLPGVIYRHNEHFLPVFFFLYFLEAKLFAAHYAFSVLLTLFVHAGVTLLLLLSLEKLLPAERRHPAPLFFLALFYAVSALHAEALHWAFEVCLMLCELVFAGTLYFLLSRQEENRRSPRALLVFFFASALAPLLFGNGFTLPALVGLFALFQERFLRGERLPSWGNAVKNSLPAALASGLGVLFPAACYHFYKEGAGHAVQESQLLANISESLKYLFVGTQAGTLLRGLGLLPDLQLTAAGDLPNFLLTPEIRPELILGLAGFLASLLLLFMMGVRKNWQYWVLGQSFLALCLALPALGRWSFGINQSLALRYHSQMLFGLLIILLPIFVKNWGRGLFFLGVFAISVQAGIAYDFSEFVKRGRDVRLALEEAEAGGKGELAAVKPDTITPALSLDRLLGILHWMKPPASQE